MSLHIITTDNRRKITDFFIEQWGSSQMVISSGIYICDELAGFFYEEVGEIIGLITYIVKEEEIEIISLDSLQEGKGIGTLLLNKVEELAKEFNLPITLITTNDNLLALKFYQKRGYRIIEIIPDAVTNARKIKPSIPLIGMEGIPLRDEMKLQKQLKH